MEGPRISREKTTITHMIEIYCRQKHHSKELCESCQELLHYAYKRLSHCRFGEQKTTCSKCPIHCYKPDMRTKVKDVMRYSGPRMLLYHPVSALRHMIDGLKKAPELPQRRKS